MLVVYRHGHSTVTHIRYTGFYFYAQKITGDFLFIPVGFERFVARSSYHVGWGMRKARGGGWDQGEAMVRSGPDSRTALTVLVQSF